MRAVGAQVTIKGMAAGKTANAPAVMVGTSEGTLILLTLSGEVSDRTTIPRPLNRRLRALKGGAAKGGGGLRAVKEGEMGM